MNQFSRSCFVKSFDSDCDISSCANLPACLPAWQMVNKALNHENVSGKRKTLKMKEKKKDKNEERKKATKIENSNTRKLNLISVVNVLQISNCYQRLIQKAKQCHKMASVSERIES